MRWLLVLFPAVLWCQGGAPVEGVVVDGDTHMALASAGVTLEGPTGRNITYSAITAADGSFRIANVNLDGDYRISFSKEGYRDPVAENSTYRQVKVAAATGAVRVRAELKPLGRFRGRVVDADRHPVAGAEVEFTQSGSPFRVLVKTGTDGTFDYQGTLDFRSFELLAVPPKELAPPKSSDDEPMAWAPTWYPDRVARSEATRIMWNGASNLEGYEIRLRTVRVFRASGAVLDDAGKPAAGASVKLVSTDGVWMPLLQAIEHPEAETVSDAEGKFELPAVRPGEWILAAEWKRGDKTLRAYSSGIVTDKDWASIRLRLQTPFTIQGTGENDRGVGMGAAMLTPVSSDMPRPLFRMSRNGHFELTEILPGQYRAVPVPLWLAGYPDSVQYGGREAMGQIVEIGDGALPIHVLYKTNGGKVQGLTEHCGFVVLAPRDPSLRFLPLIDLRPCDAGGKFQIDGTRPGDYLALAFDGSKLDMDLEMIELGQIGRLRPALMAKIEAMGENVHVDAEQTTMVNPRLAPFPER